MIPDQSHKSDGGVIPSIAYARIMSFNATPAASKTEARRWHRVKRLKAFADNQTDTPATG